MFGNAALARYDTLHGIDARAVQWRAPPSIKTRQDMETDDAEYGPARPSLAFGNFRLVFRPATHGRPKIANDIPHVRLRRAGARPALRRLRRIGRAARQQHVHRIDEDRAHQGRAARARAADRAHRAVARIDQPHAAAAIHAARLGPERRDDVPARRRFPHRQQPRLLHSSAVGHARADAGRRTDRLRRSDELRDRRARRHGHARQREADRPLQHLHLRLSQRAAAQARGMGWRRRDPSARRDAARRLGTVLADRHARDPRRQPARVPPDRRARVGPQRTAGDARGQRENGRPAEGADPRSRNSPATIL